jgi:acetate kinase
VDVLNLIILVFNPGSSSLKYALFQSSKSSFTLLASGQKDELNKVDAEQAISAAAEEILKSLLGEYSTQIREMEFICCRVVHGGADFVDPTEVTAQVLARIRELGALAPLHNPLAAAVIETCLRLLPKARIIAFFDTAFHRSLPEVAATYAVPREIASKHGLRRYGFHGIAHEYVSTVVRQSLGSGPRSSRIITCHLGNGSSICAVKDGRSIDTSMGYTPMEGLIMGTRCGDIDPGIVLQLIQDIGLAPAKVESMLNHESGLLGVSGLSSDMRILERAASEGSKEAELALECFAYRAAKYVGSYVAVLGGIDAIAFSGGIGENSSAMRARICKRLIPFGVELDEQANSSAKGKNENCISPKRSSVSVWAISANEELHMAKGVARN